MEYTCIDCGKKVKKVLGVIPHTPGEVTVLQESNCTEMGKGSTNCTVCGNAFKVKLPTNDIHELVETVVKEPTCIDPGEGRIACTRCSYEEKCSYKMKRHHYVEISTSTQYCTYHTGIGCCTGCGDRQHMTFPGGTDHKWRYNGIMKLWFCEKCNAYKNTYNPAYNSGITTPRFPQPFVSEIVIFP